MTASESDELPSLSAADIENMATAISNKRTLYNPLQGLKVPGMTNGRNNSENNGMNNNGRR